MKRRIAMISEHASPLAILGGVDSGGQNVYVAELAKHLTQIGYEVDVFTRWDDERFPKIVDWANGVRVIHVKAGPITFIKKEELLPYMADFRNEMFQFIKNEKVEYKIIHANFWMSALVAADLKKATGIPFVVTFHALGQVRKMYQGTNDKFPKERLEIEKRVIKEVDHIIAESPQDREDLINLYGADPNKIKIIPCGVNFNDFHPVDKIIARTALRLNPREKIILYVGRIVARKGIDNTIRALWELRVKYSIRARLIIVGGESDDPDILKTPEIKNLSTIAHDLRVGKYIIFAGRKTGETLKYYYSAADIFVTTPWYEPFGIAPLEAMACGTPVIGSMVGGIKYSVVDGKTGYLVPPKDPEKLSEKLSELFHNRKLRQYFRENSIHRVSSNFSWSNVANAVSNLYERIILTNQSVGEIYLDTLSIFEKSFDSVIGTFKKSRDTLRIQVVNAALALTRCVTNNGKVFSCGNGGSASDAQHFTAELVGRFQYPQRRALPFISLTSDIAVITSWSNDIGYEYVFSRQIEALGQPGDIILGISTSGNSKNVIKAFKKAKEMGIMTIGLLGGSGGEIIKFADIAIVVPSFDVQRIQEVQIHLLHTICELIERQIVSQGIAEEQNVILAKTGANGQQLRKYLDRKD